MTWYGLFVAAGFWLGAWTAARRAPRAGLKPDAVWDLLWVLIVAGIVGARALYVLTYWERDFRDGPFTEIFMVQHGGLVFHGGFIVAVLAAFGWCAWRRVPPWPMSDVLAPSIALGQALGRIGCLINGCCYGRACTLPWAIHYSKSHETHGAPVHPTQIYEAASSLVLAGALALAFGRRRFDGQLFAVYLIAYGILRGVIELFRGDYPPNTLYFGIITPAHWISAGLILAGSVLYGVRRHQSRSREEQPVSVTP